MTYKLWDTDIGNLLGEFASEGEALDFVRVLVAAHGVSATDDLALAGRDDEGRILPIVGGDDLRTRAKALDAIYDDPDEPEGRVVAASVQTGFTLAADSARGAIARPLPLGLAMAKAAKQSGQWRLGNNAGQPIPPPGQRARPKRPKK